jgi:aminoglycoside phosphotransferase family enzyme
MTTAAAPQHVSLQAKLTALNDRTIYPEPCSHVEAIETHCAWVFLTDAHAYKLKKPMRLDRMDNLHLSSRHRNCMEELRLNRRLAPTVYLDVVPLNIGPTGRISMGDGIPVEWLVKMRRLPSELLLDHALASGRVSPASVHPIGELLGDFYCRQPPVPMTGERYLRRLEQEAEGIGRALSAPELTLPPAAVAAATAAQCEFLRAESALIKARADTGKIIEAHGDLKPEHVYLGVPPCVIDCLEFDRDLRILDPLEELAYFSLECERLGAGWVAEQVLEMYLAKSGDGWDAGLFDFYLSRRSAKRALITAWHLRDPAVRDLKDWRKSAVAYLCRTTASQGAS